MNGPWLDALILYLIGLFLVPNFRAGGVPRRLAEVIYQPFIRLGLWYRWSMYAPEVPEATRLGLTGIVKDDGSFEIVPLPGCDEGAGFGKARGLRFIAWQWALCDPMTDFLKPALCDYALRLWRRRSPAAGRGPGRPVAVEVRVYRYPSPAPGQRDEPAEPEVRTVFSRAVEE